MPERALLRWLATVGEGSRPSLVRVMERVPGLLPDAPFASADLVERLQDAGLINLDRAGRWVVPPTAFVPAGKSGYLVVGAIDDLLLAKLALDTKCFRLRHEARREELAHFTEPVDDDAALRALHAAEAEIGSPTLRDARFDGDERLPRGRLLLRDLRRFGKTPFEGPPFLGALVERIDPYSGRPTRFVWQDRRWVEPPHRWAVHLAALLQGVPLVNSELSSPIWARLPRPLARAAVLSSGCPWERLEGHWTISEVPSPFKEAIRHQLS